MLTQADSELSCFAISLSGADLAPLLTCWNFWGGRGAGNKMLTR